MPRVYRTQKERERLVISEFVKQLGYRISSPKWQESPDALMTIIDASGKKRIAIEHTDHYSDTIAGRQPHYLIPPYSAPNQWGPPQ